METDRVDDPSPWGRRKGGVGVEGGFLSMKHKSAHVTVEMTWLGREVVGAECSE